MDKIINIMFTLQINELTEDQNNKLWKLQEAFCIHGLNRLLLYGLKRSNDLLHGRNTFALHYEKKIKAIKEMKNIISTNVQLVTFHNNNRLYTLWTLTYWNFPRKVAWHTRHRGNLPGCSEFNNVPSIV